ncbi:MAG: response regulator transcription factor [Chitinophagaceae bacterium]|nr:response regulator transcription factor [Chitinophagaceae bacterium]MDB5224106.1 response regulator transcription factor [Chitinophagaceae bacterium]
MSPLRVILVDDEPRGLNTMEKLLQLNCQDVTTIAACSNADTAAEKINLLKPDLIFLDISMPAKTGFDMLKEIDDIQFEVIFVTAHNQFMIEAFHFSAIDYLLKPVDDDLLVEAVKRARKRITEKAGRKHIETFLHNVTRQPLQNMKLCIPSLKGFQVVEINDILYAEAAGNYTNFFFRNQNMICTSKPIHEYEELLEDSGLVRIHKSYLINLLHIKEYRKGEGGSVILSNGTEIEVARRKKDQFLFKMKNFYKY